MTARQRREAELLQLEERAVKTFDDLAAVVVDPLRRLHHENHKG